MTKEQREKQFRKMLDKATTCDRETGYSWRFEMGEEEIKKFLDFIESEVEKAKKEIAEKVWDSLASDEDWIFREEMTLDDFVKRLVN